MAKMVLSTQILENYAWDRDGNLLTGDDAYWKPKGGKDYFVLNVDVNKASAIAEAAIKQIERTNDAYIETVHIWQVVEDNYKTPFERDQFAYEGKIVYPVKVIEV